MKLWRASDRVKPTLIASLITALASLTAAGIVANDPNSSHIAHTGIWNGSHTELNIVECSNLDQDPRTYNLVVLGPKGQRLGDKQFTIASLGTTHINLREVIKRKFNGSFGTYRLESPTGAAPTALSCLTSVYRKADKRSKKSIEFGYVISSPISVSGTSGGVLQKDVEQELLIYNAGDSAFSASIEFAGQDGAINEKSRFALDPLTSGEIRRFKLARGTDSVTTSQRNAGSAALYRIIPENSESEYGAVLVSYSKRRAGKFSYALSKLASEGSCDGGPVFVSTRERAKPVAQLANLDDSEMSVELEVRDADGALVHSAPHTLTQYSTLKLPLSPFLGTDAIGSFSARCVGEGKLLSEVVHYGLDKKERVEWAYATQARGNLGSSQIAIASSLKTAGQARAGENNPQPDNRSVIVNAGSDPLAVRLTLFEATGSQIGAVSTHLRANAAGSTGLYTEIGPDFKGLGVSISSENGAQFSSELLRIFPRKGGGVGSIVSVPSSATGSGRLKSLIEGSIETDADGINTPRLAALGAPSLECSSSASGPWSSSYCIYTYGQKIYQRITNYQANSDIEFKWTNGGTTTWNGPLPNPATPNQNYRTNSSGTAIAGPLPSASGIPTDWPARSGYRNWVCYAGTCSNEVDFTIATTNPPTPVLEYGKSATGPWYQSGLTFYYGEKIYLRLRGATASTQVYYEWTNGGTSVFGGPSSPMPNPVGGSYSTNLIGEVIAGPYPSASGIPSDGSWPVRSGYRNTVFVSGKRSNDATLTVGGAPISNYVLLQGFVYDGATGAQWTGSPITLDPYGGSVSRCGPNPGIEANTTTICSLPYAAPNPPGGYFAKNYVYSTNYTRIKGSIPAGRKALISVAPFGCTTDCHPFSSYCVAKVASSKADVKIGNIPNNPRPALIDLWWAYIPSPDPTGAVYRDCDPNTGLPVAYATGFNYNLTNRGNVTILPGGSGVATIDATLSAGTVSPVAFDTVGLPQGVTAAFSKVSCNPTCSATLTLTASSSAQPATYPITIKGSPLNKTTTFNLVVNAPPPVEKFLVQGYVYDGSTGVTWTGAAMTLDPDGTEGTVSTCGPSPTSQPGATCTVPGVNPYYAQTEILPTNRAHLTSTIPANRIALVSVCYNNGAYGPCATGTHPFSTYCAAPVVGGKVDITFNNIPTPRPSVIDVWWAYVPVTNSDGTAASYRACDPVTGTPAGPPAGFNYSIVVQSGQGSTITMNPGQNASRTIELWNVSSPSTLTYPVGLDIEGVPMGITATLSKVSCSPNCSAVLSVTAAANASSGTLNIKGSPLNKILPITITINSGVATIRGTTAGVGVSAGQEVSAQIQLDSGTPVASGGLPPEYQFANITPGIHTVTAHLPTGFSSAEFCVADQGAGAGCGNNWTPGTVARIYVAGGQTREVLWRFKPQTIAQPPPRQVTSYSFNFDSQLPYQSTFSDGPVNVDFPNASLDVSGVRSAPNDYFYSGQDLSTTTSYVYFKVYDANILVTPKTVLEYYVKPLNDLGRYVSADLKFSDGTYLRNTAAIDQYGIRIHPYQQGLGGRIAPYSWNYIRSRIGLYANNKTIREIVIGYDRPPGTGSFAGLVDDIRVSDGFPDESNPGSTLNATHIANAVSSPSAYDRYSFGNAEKATLHSQTNVGTWTSGTSYNVGGFDIAPLESTTQNNTVTTQVDGKYFHLMASTGPNFGHVEVQIDGRADRTFLVSLFSYTATNGVTFRLTDDSPDRKIDPGLHTLRFRVADPSSATNKVSLGRIAGFNAYSEAKCIDRGIPKGNFCADLYGNPSFVRSYYPGEPLGGYVIDHNFGLNGQPSELPETPDVYFIAWYGDFVLGGPTTFTATVNDGAFLIHDDRQGNWQFLVDQWHDSGTPVTYTATKTFPEEQKTQRLYFFAFKKRATGGQSVFKLRWQDPRQYRVRPIYFVPRGFTPAADFEPKIQSVVETISDYYADQLQLGGFVRRGLNMELAANGRPRVFKIDGRQTLSEYKPDQNSDAHAAVGKMLEELWESFDQDKDVIWVANPVNNNTGFGWINLPPARGGWATMNIEFNKLALTKTAHIGQLCNATISNGDSIGNQSTRETHVFAHELGHGLGSHHVRRNYDTMAYGSQQQLKYHFHPTCTLNEDRTPNTFYDRLLLNNSAFFRAETFYSDTTPPTLGALTLPSQIVETVPFNISFSGADVGVGLDHVQTIFNGFSLESTPLSGSSVSNKAINNIVYDINTAFGGDFCRENRPSFRFDIWDDAGNLGRRDDPTSVLLKPTAFGFCMSPNPSSVTVTRAAPANVDVNLTLTGTQPPPGPVLVFLTGLPPGASASSRSCTPPCTVSIPITNTFASPAVLDIEIRGAQTDSSTASSAHLTVTLQN